MSAPVVFLHGLARTHRSLSKLRKYVEGAGFPTWARTYPSRRMTLTELAEQIALWITADLGEGPFWAVTHSLGGIIARHLRKLLRWEGVVMLAPPNRGSRIAKMLSDKSLFQWFYGPVGNELADPSTWPSPPQPCGVIAGTKHLAVGNPTSWVTRALNMFPPEDPSDGTVSVWETCCPAMTDFATVDASHTWIMNHEGARDLVVRFLHDKSFGELSEMQPEWP